MVHCMRPTMRGGFTYAWYPDQRGVSCSIESNFKLEVCTRQWFVLFSYARACSFRNAKTRPIEG